MFLTGNLTVLMDTIRQKQFEQQQQQQQAIITPEVGDESISGKIAVNYTHLLSMLEKHLAQTNGSTNEFNLTGSADMLARQIFNSEFGSNILVDTGMISSSSSSNIVSDLAPIEDADESGGMASSIQIAFYVLYALICVIGLIGNALVLYVVVRTPTMHNVTNIFIANLALADILLCIFAVPITPLYLIAYKSWIFGSVLCHLLPFAQGVSVYISAFTLMSIAIDRYFVILYPFRRRMMTSTCLWVIVAIWLSTCVLTAPLSHFMELIELNFGDGEHNRTVHVCEERWPSDETRKTFGSSTSILQFVIPFVIITFCYTRVCRRLSDRAKTIPGMSVRREEQERERARKTNIMLISMVVIFVVSWLPFNIHNLIVDFYGELAAEWSRPQVLFHIVHATAMSSTCYNPFLYAWLNENFRKEFREILPCFNRNFLSRTPAAHQAANGRNRMSSNAGSGGCHVKVKISERNGL